MTVREMIKTLVMYPMDYQVVDDNRSPIMYAILPRENEVILRAKNQIDLHAYLEDYFTQAFQDQTPDREVYEELVEMGITAEDLKNHKDGAYYDWFMNQVKENEDE